MTSYSQSDVSSTESNYCPSFVFNVLDQSDNTPDPIFNFDSGTDTLSMIDPNDLSKAAIYPLRLYARYAGDPTHYTNVDTFDFDKSVLCMENS